MKAKVQKVLQGGIFYVSFTFSDFTPEELAKMRAFGVPVVQIRIGVGSGQAVQNMHINQVTPNLSAGFLTEEQAKGYEQSVLNQAKAGMEAIRQRKDEFSATDEVEI